MADFVIKPGAGVSNKLILKTQDDTPVLTTSASGVTLASATLTSPTLNSPTLVTPALGTPASGVLTNATFPAGMVRQVKQGSWGSLAQGTGARQLPNTISFSTAILATSHVLIHYYFTFIPRGSTAQGSNDYGTAWLTGSNFGSTTSGLLIQSFIAYYQDTFHDRHTKSGSVLDTNPTASPAYGLYASCEGAAFQLAHSETPIGATLYEILV